MLPPGRRFLCFLFLSLLLVIFLILLGLERHGYFTATPLSWESLAGIPHLGLLLVDQQFFSALCFTLQYALSSALIQLFLGFHSAYYLVKYQLGLPLVFLFPLLIPPALGAVMWRLSLIPPQGGVVKTVLDLSALSISPWELLPPVPLLILVDTWIYTPFVILVFYRGISSYPSSLEEAAALEGVGEGRWVLQFLLPFLKPHLFLVLTFRFLVSLREWELFYVLTGGAPLEGPINLSVLAYQRVSSHLGQGLVLLGVLFLFLLLILSLFFWWWEG